jgi:hypothetical protein
MEQVLAFLQEAWHALGLPAQVQFNNAREFVGCGKSAHWLRFSRVLRLCLRFQVESWLIPPAKPERNGSIENFNR